MADDAETISRRDGAGVSATVVVSSEAELLDHSDRIVAHMRARAIITFPDLGYVFMPNDEVAGIKRDLEELRRRLDALEGKR